MLIFKLQQWNKIHIRSFALKYVKISRRRLPSLNLYKVGNLNTTTCKFETGVLGRCRRVAILRKLHVTGHPANRAFLSQLAWFWGTWERLYWNRIRSLLSMRYMWLGCSFVLRPNSLALGSAGSVFCYDHRFMNREFKHYVYGKRETSDSSWECLKIENEQIKTAQNNSYG